jgi:hypothetical protein
MILLYPKFIQHPLLPRPVPVHCLVSTPHIHDTVMPRPLVLLHLLISPLACIRGIPRDHPLLPKPDQFGKFSNRCFLMNSLFHVWESTSLYCSRSMTAGVSLRGTTLAILALRSHYSIPRDSLQDWRVVEKVLDLALSQHGSSLSPRRECVLKGLFAAPVQVYSNLVPMLLTLDTLRFRRFPGPTSIVERGLYVSTSLPPSLLYSLTPPSSACRLKSFMKDPAVQACFIHNSVHSSRQWLFPIPSLSLLFTFVPLFCRPFVSRNLRCRHALLTFHSSRYIWFVYSHEVVLLEIHRHISFEAHQSISSSTL